VSVLLNHISIIISGCNSRTVETTIAVQSVDLVQFCIDYKTNSAVIESEYIEKYIEVGKCKAGDCYILEVDKNYRTDQPYIVLGILSRNQIYPLAQCYISESDVSRVKADQYVVLQGKFNGIKNKTVHYAYQNPDWTVISMSDCIIKELK
jgi:hypothetical protein